uniref:Transmembrane protein 181-like n=1 Tax=Phallusia mammillata TaxID=59560 RepID=A0A6F9DVA7_9ASCI|nr:transmembrane protein 181-like [Phallusia mammillata]
MSVYLHDDSEEERSDDHYFSQPTLYDRLSEAKTTFEDYITYGKRLYQDFENYVVPDCVIADRLGQKPKGRSIQMRLYSLSKRQFVIVFATFIFSFLITVLIGLAGPSIISTKNVNSTQFQQKPKSMSVGPFSFASPVLTTFNQQIWLLSHIHVNNPTGASFSQNFTMEVLFFPFGPDGAGSEGMEKHSRQRKLSCYSQGWCEPIVVLHLGYLEYSAFQLEIKFIGLENLRYPVDDVMFSFKMFNPTFTQVEIWFRFVFLVVTFLVTCMFAHGLRKYHIRNWTIEQKWMSLLLPLLLLYDDPIFPLSFLVNSWVPGMLDAMFQATFLCMLLLFWLCVYHGIRKSSEKRPFFSFYLPKLVICGLLWLAAITLGSWQQYNELLDPTYQTRVDIKNFVGMKVFFFLIGGVYLLYLGFLLVRACSELHSNPYNNLRLKFLTGITACVVAVSFAIVVLRFGTQVLQDNFVAEISTKYKNSAEFVCFYGLLNFYTYTLAFVYSPSENSGPEPVFRADTGFTLLNDSDEDVLYGNEIDETPLTNGATAHQFYDSD